MMKTPSNKSEQKNTPTADFKAEEISNMLRNEGRTFLSTLKQKSIRNNNSWFRVLTIDKRRLIDAVIQTVDKVKSALLIKILSPLVGKLLQAIGGVSGLLGRLCFGMKTFGAPLAQRISQIAKSWGNKLAASWAKDRGFIRFLSVIDMNDLPIFRVSTKL